MVTWGKVCSSPFLSHFVSGCLNDCALSSRWFARQGVQVVGARSATYVRARPKFLLKCNSSVSAQYLQNFSPAGHRFLIPYALHRGFLVWLVVGVRGEPVWSRCGRRVIISIFFFCAISLIFLFRVCGRRFVCLCGRIFVCGDSLSDVCVTKVLSTHAKRRLPHINKKPSNNLIPPKIIIFKKGDVWYAHRFW